MPAKMDIKSDELMIWARTVYGEARGEGYLGMVAVAWVIRNRVETDLGNDAKPDWWGEGVKGVCQAPKQFSCWNPGDPNGPAVHMAALNDTALQDAYGAVIGVARGRETDPTNGSTHYYRTSMGWPKTWGKPQPVTVIIGRHSFHKNVS